MVSLKVLFKSQLLKLRRSCTWSTSSSLVSCCLKKTRPNWHKCIFRYFSLILLQEFHVELIVICLLPFTLTCVCCIICQLKPKMISKLVKLKLKTAFRWRAYLTFVSKASHDYSSRFKVCISSYIFKNNLKFLPFKCLTSICFFHGCLTSRLPRQNFASEKDQDFTFK